ncbi:MAG TPA: ATP-binding cassette domain-containing protein [Candidatus Kapabacteria bacterium]|nr:ATP-binding cassette domain-containing protein [Candidatus Kapabacteria bacterium]
MGAVLELKNVSKFYGDFKAVNDVSFSLDPGRIYGFLGPNGAGKTTTIRMILDIVRPSAGSISILGAPSAMHVRNRLGYLPEEKGLYKKMKAWSVIAYFATLKGLSRQDAKRRAFELLERFGLKDFAEKKTDALSKGMGQKVQVLASIAHDPEFVILDEPFSGLDPVNQQVMEEIIRDMAARGRTVLFSTHVMQHAERLCERIILVTRGEKIFDGTIAEAKRKIPRRVAIETARDVNLTGISSLHEVISVSALPPRLTDDGAQQWEIQMRDNAEASTILRACFESGIQLRGFQYSEPTLHDVFVQLVGPEAREASFR